MVGVLRRLRKMTGCKAKLQLYRTAILPHLTYCHIVRHFCKQTDVSLKGYRNVRSEWFLILKPNLTKSS